MKSEVDDWLSELPPLDGADDEPTADDGSADDLPAGLEGDASLDDTNADDLEIDEGLDSTDHEAPAADGDDTWEADVGEAEIDLDDEDGGDGPEGDAPGLAESDADLDEDLPTTDDDAGEEGTTDAIEQSIDEELPALDADDEGDFEDTLMLEPGFGAPERAAVEWAEDPWVGSPGDDRALLFSPSEVDPVVAMALCVTSERLVSVAVALRLHVEVTTADKPRASEVRFPFASVEPPLVATGNQRGVTVLWAVSRSGDAARSDDLGETWSRCASPGRSVFALATNDDGSLLALVGDDAGSQLAVSVDGACWTKERISFDGASSLVFEHKVWLAARGGALALGDATAVFVSRDGRGFQRVARSMGAAAGVFAGQGSYAPLIFASSPRSGDDAARLLRVSADNRVEIVADLAADDDDDEHHDSFAVLALAWDETQGKLWVATDAHVWGFSSPIAKPAPAIS